jgi:predicted CXXCH cytochrome family protein
MSLLVIASFQVVVSGAGSLCANCHQTEVSQWASSHHALAMLPANSESIAGNFDQGHFTDSELAVHFRQQGGAYLIQVKKAGEAVEWEVKYSFGAYPLQQYLIDVGDGRLQAFNIAWDTREKSAGGQRWFRLDEPGENHPGDAMHWTGIYQNWNNQCADCHTTGLRRNYDAATDIYRTTWAQMAVGCSACHAAATEHAAARQNGVPSAAGVGLAALGEWVVNEAQRPPRHQGAPSSVAQVPTCGRCHALRTSMKDGGVGEVHNEFSLSRLEQPLYFSDGRVREEVFVLGSFEQSKMYEAGVVCSDCHNPHSGSLKAEGNAVCTQCHNAREFNTSEHHHHLEGSEGAECVNCHMPQSTFMKIDDRREHSFMIPRPDVSKVSGSPDVCLSCHLDKDASWSIDTVEDWFPDIYQNATWHHVQHGDLTEVISYLVNGERPAIRRATLLEQRGKLLVGQHQAVIEKLIESDDAILRESAFRMLRYGPAEAVSKLLEAGLRDEALVVRIAAFESLMLQGVIVDSGSWELVRDEYEHFLEMQSDLPPGAVLKARYLLSQNKVYRAEQQLKIALKKDSGYVPAAILLTDILRSGGRYHEAMDLTNQTLLASSDSAPLTHLRGLINLKLKDYPAALLDLEKAAKSAPGEWLFGYRYAMALYQLKQREKAREMARNLAERFPNNTQIVMLLRLF